MSCKLDHSPIGCLNFAGATLVHLCMLVTWLHSKTRSFSLFPSFFFPASPFLPSFPPSLFFLSFPPSPSLSLLPFVFQMTYRLAASTSHHQLMALPWASRFIPGVSGQGEIAGASVQAYRARMISSLPPHSGPHLSTPSLLAKPPPLRCAPAAHGASPADFVSMHALAFKIVHV